MQHRSEPLIDLMAKYEPKRTALLLRIMERPAMFFGTARFDYMYHFLNGYDSWPCEKKAYKKAKRLRRKFYDDIRFTMEYWLLHTQSATYHGCLTGWSLFARCFGCGQEAFDAYRTYLCSCFSRDIESLDYALYMYGHEHKIPFHIGYDITPEEHERMAQIVLGNIKDIIHNAGLAYDQLRAYVCRDDYFLQVRFLIHNDSGWMDDSALIMNPENHDLLIATHAYANNASEAALILCGFDVFDTRNRDDRYEAWMDTNRQDLPYDLTFASDYAKWKNEIINEA